MREELQQASNFLLAGSWLMEAPNHVHAGSNDDREESASRLLISRTFSPLWPAREWAKGRDDYPSNGNRDESRTPLIGFARLLKLSSTALDFKLIPRWVILTHYFHNRIRYTYD